MSTEPSELKLYFWPTPNGYKVSVLLEILGLDYQLVPINITEGQQHEPDFVAKFPSRKIPGLIHHRGEGVVDRVLMESGAILLYLAEWQKRLLPSDPNQYWQVLQWLFWQVGGLGPMAGQAHHFRLYAPESIAYAIDRYTRETHKYYAVLESQLSTSPFLTDELSIADVAVLPWVYRHARHGVDLDQFPAVAVWYERLMGRDDVKSGFAAGESLIATGDLTDAGAKQHLF